jgi:hypothetical protein
MAKFKDFGNVSLDENLEPISFKLNDEEFECVKALPGKVLLEMVAKSSSEEASDQASMVSDFFAQALTDESLERFNALISSKDKVVTAETLGDITGWLVEQYADRPNQQPEV